MSHPPAFVRSDRPLILGHRGERRIGPENTLSAFERALDLGADGIELDVRCCKSGELIVLHDEDLDRVTGGRDKRRAEDLTTADLKTVELSRLSEPRRPGEASVQERVPLLSEVLEMASARDAIVNVEMKRDVPSRTEVVVSTVRLLRSFLKKTKLIVSSFDPVMLLAFGGLLPKVPTALLVHKSSYHQAMLHARRLTLATGLHIEHVLLDEERRARVQALPYSGAWTVNSANDAHRLAALGVKTLITDDPGHLLRSFT